MSNAAHAGAIGMLGVAAAAGVMVLPGVAAALSLGISMSAGTSFLIFGTMAIQLFPGAISMTQQVNEELQRRKTICDQVQAVRDRIAKYKVLQDDLDKLDITEITTKLTDLNGDAKAANKKLAHVELQFYKNLSITILMYVAIIAILGYIITSKKNMK